MTILMTAIGFVAFVFALFKSGLRIAFKKWGKFIAAGLIIDFTLTVLSFTTLYFITR